MKTLDLKLKQIDAYTVYSSDDERSGSTKGLYKDFNVASVKAKGAGWYGADGEVQNIQVWQDEKGELWNVKRLGKFTDEEEKYRKDTMNSIKAKLTPEELKLLGL